MLGLTLAAASAAAASAADDPAPVVATTAPADPGVYVPGAPVANAFAGQPLGTVGDDDSAAAPTDAVDVPAVAPARSDAAAPSAAGTTLRAQPSPRAVASAATPGPTSSTEQPNIMTTALPTLGDFVGHPGLVIGGAFATVALLALVILPVELLNASLLAGYDLLFGWIYRHTPARVRGYGARIQVHPIAGGVALTAIAALLFSFNDPEFGSSLESLRLFLELTLALGVIGFLATAVTALILRERWHVASAIQLKPFMLVLSVVGVIVSRLLGFSPGFMVGLVLGVAIAENASSRDAGRAALVRASVVLAFGISAWLGYNALVSAGAGESHEFLPHLAVETLAAITTEGLTALVICLLPLRFLEGQEIFAMSRRTWAVAYTACLAAFCILVLSTQRNWRAIEQSITAWLAVLLGFAVVCIVAYLVIRSRTPAVGEHEPTDAGR